MMDDDRDADSIDYEQFSWEDDLRAAGATVGQRTVSWLDLRGGDMCNFEFDDLVKWIPTLLSAEKLYMLYDPTFCKLDQVENVLPLFTNLTMAYISYDGFEADYDYDIDWRLLRTPAFLRLHSLRLDLPKSRKGLKNNSTFYTNHCAEDEIVRYCNDFSALPDGREKLVYLSGVSIRFVGRLLEAAGSCYGPLTVFAYYPEEFLWEAINSSAERASLFEAYESWDPPYKRLKSRSYRLNIFVVDKSPVHDARGDMGLKLFILSTTNSVQIKRGLKGPQVSCIDDFE